jgi:hypothetical protein
MSVTNRMVIVAIIAALSCSIAVGSPGVGLTPGEYKVLADYFLERSPNASWETHIAVVTPTVSLEQHRYDSLNEAPMESDHCPNFPLDLVSAFRAICLDEVMYKPNAFPHVKVTVFTRAEFDRYLVKSTPENWARFERDFPGSGVLHYVSRVAIDRTGDWAMFYHGTYKGGWNASSSLVVMRKAGPRWAVACSYDHWDP